MLLAVRFENSDFLIDESDLQPFLLDHQNRPDERRLVGPLDLLNSDEHRLGRRELLGFARKLLYFAL